MVSLSFLLTNFPHLRQSFQHKYKFSTLYLKNVWNLIKFKFFSSFKYSNVQSILSTERDNNITRVLLLVVSSPSNLFDAKMPNDFLDFIVLRQSYEFPLFKKRKRFYWSLILYQKRHSSAVASLWTLQNF